MHAQGIVEPSGSTVRELWLILNWIQVCFLENAHLKTENVENIPQKYIQGVPGGMCRTLGGCSLC